MISMEGSSPRPNVSSDSESHSCGSGRLAASDGSPADGSTIMGCTMSHCEAQVAYALNSCSEGVWP